MKRKTYILTSLAIAAVLSGLVFWIAPSKKTVSAQRSGDKNSGVTEYNAVNEFSLVQGGTSGVWRYGFTSAGNVNDFNDYTLNNPAEPCGAGLLQRWFRAGEPFSLPSIWHVAGNEKLVCFGTEYPADMLNLHPSDSGLRSVLRWTAPADGTYQMSGVFRGLDANSGPTADVRIVKNGGAMTEQILFNGTIVGFNSQQAFNQTVTVAAGDTLDFSVGNGGNGEEFDMVGLALTIGQPVTDCISALAGLAVNLPAENSIAEVAGMNFNGSLVGDAAFTNTGKVGRAFAFDGNGDEVVLPDKDNQDILGDITIEAWIKPAATGGDQIIVDKRDADNQNVNYALYLSGGTLTFSSRNGGGAFNTYSAPGVIPTGVYTHVAAAISGTDLIFYRNGVEIHRVAYNFPRAASSGRLQIGGLIINNFSGAFFNGEIDEVSIYRRALSQTELFDIFQRGSFGKCRPVCAETPEDLISWYAGEENALDSRSHNHGTNHGVTYAAGKVGQAIFFDNDLDAVTTNTAFNQPYSQLSVEAWVYPTSHGQGDSGVSQFGRKVVSNTQSDGFSLSVHNGFLQADYRLSNGDQLINAATNQLPLNEWSHIAMTYNGSVIKGYVNGVEVISQNATGTIENSSNANSCLMIGNDPQNSCTVDNRGFSWRGGIDEPAIYARGLSQAEIQAIYNAGSAGKCKPSPINPPANQVAWYTADGETEDFTGSNSAGTFQGDTNYRVGRVGQAFNFDGNGDYISTTDSANWDFGTGDFAIEAWFNTPNPTGTQRIISAGSQADGANNLWSLGYGDNGDWGGGRRINFAVFNGGGYSDFSSDPVTFQPNTWHHAAVVRSGTSFTFYLDGVLVGTRAVGAGFTINGGSTGAIIGARYNQNPSAIFEYANGRLDEISLYSRALSASEIAAVYNAGTAGKLKSVFTSPPITLSENKQLLEQGIPQMTTVDLTSATVTFHNVTSAGFTSQSGVDLGLLPPLPEGAEFTGLAYDISTTAGYQSGSPGDVQVCFNIPAILGSYNFQYLKIYHLENGVWVDRTDGTSSSPVLCTSGLTSLSTFAIANFVPLAASATISGRVRDQKGNPLSRVGVTLTDLSGNSRQAMTNSLGYYSFEAEVGQTYILSAVSRRYSFTPATQIVSLYENVSGLNFNAEESSGEESDFERKGMKKP